MRYLVLSRIMDNGSLKGFTIIAESGSVNFVNLDRLRVLCESMNVDFINARYSKEYRTLEGTQGSLSEYPSVDKNCNLIGRNGLIVYKTILDRNTGKPIGCTCFNATGVRYNLSFAKISELLKLGNLACNFELKVNKDGRIAVPKQGGTFDTVTIEVKKKAAVYNSNTGEEKPQIFKQRDNTELPTVGVYNLDEVYASEFNKSAEEKLLLASMNLRKLTPYYFCIYQAIKKRPVRGFGTLGVTEDTLFYDVEFISGLSVAELTFVLIHEVCHIAMQHSSRFGKRENHDLWNVATDLYINSIICEDFGVSYQGAEKEFTKSVTLNGRSETIKAVLKAPSFGVFLESIGETLDLAKDTPETIYERLYKENKNFSLNRNGQGQGQSGQGQSEQGQNGQGQSGQEQNGQEQSGQGQGQSLSNSEQDDIFNGSGSFNNSDSGQGDLDDGGQGGSQVQEVNVVYNGKKLTGKIMKDVMSNVEGKTKEDNKKRVDSATNTLTRMNTKIQLEKEKHGLDELDRGFSASGGSLIQRYINFGLSAGVDWRVILRNVSKKNPKKTFTLAQPNQDYMNMGVTIADRRRIGKPEDIANIKIAIDVSGSVSQKTLNWYLSEINNIFNYYNVSGELIYWSTKIGDSGDFRQLKDMLRVQPNSTGGTDAKCVFDYLCGKIKTETGKIEKTKPRDISLLLIITDGYFSINFEDYASYFAKRTVWLIDGNPVTSKIPFGKILSISEDPKRNQ